MMIREQGFAIFYQQFIAPMTINTECITKTVEIALAHPTLPYPHPNSYNIL